MTVQVLQNTGKAILIKTIKGFKMYIPICKWVKVKENGWAEIDKEFFLIKKQQQELNNKTWKQNSLSKITTPAKGRVIVERVNNDRREGREKQTQTHKTNLSPSQSNPMQSFKEQDLNPEDRKKIRSLMKERKYFEAYEYTKKIKDRGRAVR